MEVNSDNNFHSAIFSNYVMVNFYGECTQNHNWKTNFTWTNKQWCVFDPSENNENIDEKSYKFETSVICFMLNR